MLESKPIYVKFDGMSWPHPAGVGDLDWRLRYAPDGITRDDMVYAASILSAYTQLLAESDKVASGKLRKIRKLVKSDDTKAFVVARARAGDGGLPPIQTDDGVLMDVTEEYFSDD